MQCLNTLRASSQRLSCLSLAQPQFFPNFLFIRSKRSSPCDHCLPPHEKKPCFDIRNVFIERGTKDHIRVIKSFLNTQYWPREPSVIGLWMCLDSPYLKILTEKYAETGDRFLAFEHVKRTNECRLIGVAVANRVYPWMVGELEKWAASTPVAPEKYRMYFCAHCLRSPNVFQKYNVDYIYDVEVLGTSAEVTGQGVGTLLLKRVLENAQELRHPLVHVVSLSAYSSKICEKCGLKRCWSMEYSDYIDECGQKLFFPRTPHTTVGVYIKKYDPKKGGEEPCKPPF